MAEFLLKRGFLVEVVSKGAYPDESGVLRFLVNIEHSEKQIEELTTANKILPVDQYDPVGLSGPKDETDSSQPLTIRVTDLEGYAFTYVSARLEAGRITAKRTLGDIRDIKGLPDDVVAQLIASWSPPEWIELEIKADPATKQVYITGIRWRLHVTYSSDSGHEVSRIHTPYESGLRLTQGDINVAEGAAEEEHL